MDDTDIEESAEDLLNQAIQMASRAYAAHVRDMAEDIIQDILSGDIEDREALFTRVHEDVDGDGWVIWTNKAKLVILVSGNAEHGLDEGLVDTSSFKDGLPWSQMAYCALDQDLYEVLHDMGEEHAVDINADDLWDEDETDLFERVRERLVEIVTRDKSSTEDPRKSAKAIADALEGEQKRLANHKDFIDELKELYEAQWEEQPDVGAD